MQIDLTAQGLFNGLYETHWLHSDKDIDYIMELSDHLGLEYNDIDVTLDFDNYLKAIGELYTAFFSCELEGDVRLHHVYSPKYYNYDTDHIIIEWLNDDLTEEQKQAEFARVVAETIEDSYHEDFETIMLDDENGYELYTEYVKYDYKDVELYWNMTKKELEELKK